jgi:hypothetical protein
MLEFLVELSEINTLYAIYTGLIIGLAFKYLWSLNCEYWESATFTSYKKNNRFQSSHIVLKFFRNQTNSVVIWIIQIVRRKNVFSDESDSVCLLSN